MTPRRYGPLAYLPITRRPKLTWPGGARVALWVNPNIERRRPAGTDGSQTLRWSKGDSNSPSHPERQRSEGCPMDPAHRSRFRNRALLRSAIVLLGLGHGTGRAEAFVLGMEGASTAVA